MKIFLCYEHDSNALLIEKIKDYISVDAELGIYPMSIEYDIINHDYVIYDRSRVEESNRDMLKKIVSTLEMV